MLLQLRFSCPGYGLHCPLVHRGWDPVPDGLGDGGLANEGSS